MSNDETSDTHFMNSFSVVLGILIFIAICIFAYARWLGHTQLREQMTQAMPMSAVQKNITPFAREAISGQDNSALAVPSASTTAAPAGAIPKTGKDAFEQVCSSCHALGLNGAPKAGDRAAWAPRIAQGMAVLYQHALHGFGPMPPRGGTNWPDATIRAAVDYMVSLAK
ncbi:MAG TPA: c-type cytochrome [Steroidobacteraceae bacterium]|nr:c-type cytochrome [Steroidobacteraceae bacterium]